MEMFFVSFTVKSYHIILYCISYHFSLPIYSKLSSLIELIYLFIFSIYSFVSSEFNEIFGSMDGYHSWHMLS